MDSDINGELTDESVSNQQKVISNSLEEAHSDHAIKDWSSSNSETLDSKMMPSKISNSESCLIKHCSDVESPLPKESVSNFTPNLQSNTKSDLIDENGISDSKCSHLTESSSALIDELATVPASAEKEVPLSVINSDSCTDKISLIGNEGSVETNTTVYEQNILKESSIGIECDEDFKCKLKAEEIDGLITNNNLNVSATKNLDFGSNNDSNLKSLNLSNEAENYIQNCPGVVVDFKKNFVPVSSNNQDYILLKSGVPKFDVNESKDFSQLEQSQSNLTIKNILTSGKQNYEIKDLSAPNLNAFSKNQCESASKLVDPLEKLNEHLNSIGYVSSHSDSYNQVESTAAAFPLQNLDVSKNVHKDKGLAHSHDRNIESSDSLIFTELSNKETGFPDIFNGLVTLGKYISVKGDFTLRSSEALVESASLIAPYLLKEPDSFPPRESKQEPKDFFHSTAGELLIGIGISRVNEWFHRDMTRIKKRHMKREGKSPQLEEDLAMHEKFYAEAKKANSVYSFSFKSCRNCGFTTESAIVMEGHLLVPHITPRREYRCNFCDAINRDPKGMLDHMETAHGKVGRIQPSVLFFECPFCTSFESNSKVKLNTHLAKCQRFFDLATNQAPPRDFEFPALTPKPITVAVVKAYEKSLSSMQRGRGRPRKDTLPESLHINQYTPNINPLPVASNQLPPYRQSSSSPLAESLGLQNQIIPPIQMPNMNIRSAHANPMNPLRPTMPHMHLPTSPNSFYQVVNSGASMMPMLGNSHLVTSPSQFPFSSTLVNSGSKKTHAPTPQFFNSLFNSGIRQQNSPKTIPEVTITPLPKLQGPYPVPMAKPSTTSSNPSMQSNSLVVCEICDGYIKDLEQLRTHMQLIHKVKIHPKMLVSRPPLNCQKCQWRFFTDQGLERHLLGAHGLVTSNMQELANKGKDAGCCTICGRVYASKLVNHMNQTHKISLKPAHLSYKCTVCSATFNLYRLFENHVYLVHSGAAKRQAEGISGASKKLKPDSNFEGEYRKDKRTSRDAGEENIKMCKECGANISHSLDSQKCEKCLKSDMLMQGKTFRDELRKSEKCEEAAC